MYYLDTCFLFFFWHGIFCLYSDYDLCSDDCLCVRVIDYDDMIACWEDIIHFNLDFGRVMKTVD